MKESLNYGGIKFISELKIPIEYKGLALEADLRLDFWVENILPVEIKAVEYILPVHEAQIITYLKLLEKPEGLLINFNVTNIFYEGQKTYVNELFQNLED